jgi:hypothetical protein
MGDSVWSFLMLSGVVGFVEIPVEVDRLGRSDRGVERGKWLKKYGLWNQFQFQKNVFRGMGAHEGYADALAEGWLRSLVFHHNQRVKADSGAEVDHTFDESDQARAKLLLRAKGKEATLPEEVAWVSRNVRREWKDVGKDVPSEAALTLLEFANENEEKFRAMYHSKPKATREGADGTEAAETEDQDDMMAKFERLLGAGTASEN